MDLRSLSEDAPESQWGSLGATRSVPSSSSRSITAQRRQADQIVVPKVSGRRRQAADGQQPVSVTTGECARKPWRIMTADLWHRWPLTWRSSHAFTILNTTQLLARRLRADLARRKPEVQTPSPPPHNPVGQSVVGASSAALLSSPEAPGATLGPRPGRWDR